MSWASERGSSRAHWNHNSQFHGWILHNMPEPCGSALDVGCGEGVLTPRLAERSTRAVGIDVSPGMIAIAREIAERSNVTYVVGDAMSYPLPEEGFDFIVAVAAIHHMPLGAALRRFAKLLRHRGVLAVVGLARNRSLVDYAISAASVPASSLIRIRSGYWDSPAPRLDPKTSFSEIRELAREIVPGAEVRRRLFFRYTLLWRKP